MIAYGQTETSPVVTMSDAGDSIEVRVKTVGRAMPQTEIKDCSLGDRRDAAPRRAGRGVRARLRADEGLRRRSRKARRR